MEPEPTFQVVVSWELLWMTLKHHKLIHVYLCMPHASEWLTNPVNCSKIADWNKKRRNHKIIGEGSILFSSLGCASQNQCNSSCHETCQHQPIHFRIASYASKHALSLTCESISWSFLRHTRCNIPHLWVLPRFLKPPSHWFPSVAIRLQKANRRDHQADQTPCSCWD